MDRSHYGDNANANMGRRDFLRLASVGLPLSSFLLQEPAGGQALPSSPLSSTPASPPPASTLTDAAGLIVRQRQPDNLEFPFSSLSSLITPNERFYVRCHFAIPQLEAREWRLRVEGAVAHPLDLSYDDLLNMAVQTRSATLECAGNARGFLTPAAKGVQWSLGAISNADWTGVPLRDLLKRAGVQRGAVDVILEGADSGELKDPPKPTGPIHFARSLPLAIAMRPEVLLAHHMNGMELPQAHGFPVRAVVPGWYGMASVKWLTRIVVTDRPFHGHFQTVDYAIWERSNGLPTRVPVTEMQVKAEIARPERKEALMAGSAYRVHGAAWTGDADIEKVDFSADGGQTWKPTRLLGSSRRYIWRMWEYSWQVPSQPGSYTLMARATDTQGHVQVMSRQPDRENYAINHVLPIDVDVH